ncbi:hypothetical protein KP509_16G046700 [Ceratopteris richardii]|uniref:Uncharacterized protein n=1 Tax=Ceratopteris richardii TaxID=49495 RepID=A0A8T2T302_CERRI|nr:hypothetical protein KP509_16G046700 [Ceratopteris richardii]
MCAPPRSIANKPSIKAQLRERRSKTQAEGNSRRTCGRRRRRSLGLAHGLPGKVTDKRPSWKSD